MLMITGFIIVAVIIGMFIIRDRGVDTDFTAKTTKIGLVLTGPIDDNNFNETHYDSMMRIKDELNLRLIIRENIPEDETCAKTIEELITKEDCEFIIAPSYNYKSYLMEEAEKHPEVCFLHPGGSEKMANLSSFFGRMYQARYLSGIVAGMRTASQKIGYVAAFPNSQVIRGINAFTRGVRSVAPEAVVYVKYCNSWVDDQAAETAARELLASHSDIDVFAMHTNSNEPNRVAAENGIWSIGYNKDNAEFYPDSYLTACEWDWSIYYRESILSFLQGKFHGENVLLNMETGIVRLSPLTKNTAPGTEEAVEKAKELFESRSFEVFYGPVIDNEGATRVPEGESMSDDEMQNRFDWYVEGVTVEE